MFQGSFNGVLRKFQKHFREFTWMFFKPKEPRKFQRCFEEISRMFQGCFKDVSRMFQGSFNGVLRKFQGRFREVAWMFQKS